MKSKPFSEIAINIYIHCWYIPLFAFLLGVKLCLISMLIDSIHKGEQNHFEELVNDELEKLTTKSRRQTQYKYQSTVPTTTISPEVNEDWKTLDDLENSMIEPTSQNRTDPDSIWVIFNRVPRCGGETIVQLLYKLGETNGFNHQEHEYRTPWPRFLLEQEQENLVTWFEYQHLPKSYDRHFFFVNFTSYQKYIKERPIYVNIVRDPILRLKSFYQSKRVVPEIARLEMERRDEKSAGSGLEWFHRTFEECVTLSDPECNYEAGNKDFTMMVPFFCGQHPSCVLLNDKWAVQRAKFTIEKYYSVVGVLEKWNQTLSVLQSYVPKFFSGANQLYYEKGSSQPRSRKSMDHISFNNIASTTAQVPNALRSLLESKLHGEFELYNFINQRLKLQFSSALTK